jgi:hypothetical protein
VRARVSNYSPTLGKKIAIPFGKLPNTITFTEEAGLGKREEFHNVIGLQLAHAEITWEGLPVEVASCVRGKAYALKYRELSKEIRAKISDRVFKIAIITDTEIEWYRVRPESLNQDWEDLQSLYHARSNYYLDGQRVTEAAQLYPDCKIMRLYQSGRKGRNKGYVRAEYLKPSITEEQILAEAAEERLPSVELEAKSSEEDGIINFQDGYRRFKTGFKAQPTMQELALRMESYLGRYINPQCFTRSSGIYRAPPGQVISLKWGKRIVSLEVSLERPARDIKKWARDPRVAVPVLRHVDGAEASDLSISGGERLELFSGSRVTADIKRLVMQEGGKCRETAVIGSYSETELHLKIEWSLGYIIAQNSIRSENGDLWNGEFQDGDKILIPHPIRALLIYREQEQVVKLGWDSPVADVGHWVYQKWKLLPHQFEASWNGLLCSDIEVWPKKLVIRIETVKSHVYYAVRNRRSEIGHQTTF